MGRIIRVYGLLKNGIKGSTEKEKEPHREFQLESNLERESHHKKEDHCDVN
jgi:hypothetical protein